MAVAGAVGGLHVLGFALLLAGVSSSPADAPTGTTLTLGVGLTAYALGARHAFDADHISAIDTTTRKLLADGERPVGVGLFFSLGHSTIVLALALLLGLGVKALVGPVTQDSSTLHLITGVIGPTVSGTFLYVIGAINLVILARIVRVSQAMRRGRISGPALQAALAPAGPLSGPLARPTRAIRRPWHMYPLGVLFGLGFDTATEISLLLLTSGAAGAGLQWSAILCLPVLFAAGMTLFDTLDGSLMNVAYGWASSHPARRVYYNLTMTGLSVAVALVVGTVQLIAVASERLDLHGGLWAAAAAIDLNVLGYGIVAVFVLTWAAALTLCRLAPADDR
jgi:nickel/cobalt transporter (NiCoT) family protein